MHGVNFIKSHAVFIKTLYEKLRWGDEKYFKTKRGYIANVSFKTHYVGIYDFYVCLSTKKGIKPIAYCKHCMKSFVIESSKSHFIELYTDLHVCNI